MEGVAPGTEIHGKEAVGGMEFAPVVLAPGQSVQYVVRFGMTGNETTLPQILAACDTAEKAETILVEVKSTGRSRSMFRLRPAAVKRTTTCVGSVSSPSCAESMAVPSCRITITARVDAAGVTSGRTVLRCSL